MPLYELFGRTAVVPYSDTPYEWQIFIVRLHFLPPLNTIFVTDKAIGEIYQNFFTATKAWHKKSSRFPAALRLHAQYSRQSDITWLVK